MNLIIILLVSSIFLLCLSPVFPKATDILTPSNTLSINQTLISSGGKFELGFFTLGKPTKYYLGIWYKDIPSTDVKVWVANRDSPSMSNHTTLKLQNDAKLVIFNNGSNPIWSSSNQSKAVNPVLQLLDSGNLVVRVVGDHNPDHYIWQSFDNPTDTLLPGQKLGWNLETGLDLYINSWRGPEDPGIGDYSFKLDYKGDPEIYLWQDKIIIYRSGPWVGQRFSGVPEMKSGNSGFKFTFYTGQDEVYYSFELPENDTVKSRLMVSSDGYLQRWTWIPDKSRWNEFWYARKDPCDYYRFCGSYSICNVSALFNCQCPPGFKPKDPIGWGLRDGTSGCVRKTKLDCGSDRFIRLENMKLPETSTSFVDKSMSLEECEEMCKRNCSCTAYANAQLVQKVGSGCVIWTDNLSDMRDYVEGGQDLYLRLAASDVAAIRGTGANDSSNKAKTAAIAAVISVVATIILVGVIIMITKKRKSSRDLQRASRTETGERSQEILFSGQIISSKREYTDESKKDNDFELPLFDLYTLSVATNNFSDANKLGQGGFGRVYKGVLLDGQEFAVKRLCKGSGQGVEEFKNEVKLIAKLQHRNLVRLLGYCVEMDEKMLIYEYLKNRSLDSILFNKEKSSMLSWQKRFDIICGIARGLLYLHQDSRYRIIHRDLKASNILLDGDMDPKISDFGMARIFGGDETEGNTRRVVGTYGYMAPEYAMDGLFSIKSDVFSFGVLVLEIISGKKNRGFYSNNELNLLGYAFKLWKEGKGTELLDKSMGELYSIREVSRCIQVGLLCVQERAEERPTMASVVLMLSSESAILAQPKLPGFCIGWNPNETDSSSSRQDESFTVNEVTVTMLNAR